MRVPLTIGDSPRSAPRSSTPNGSAWSTSRTRPAAGSARSRTAASTTWRAAQAAALDAMGIGRGERVAIVSQNAARLAVSFFGVSGFGRVLVPINFRLTTDEIRYIVEHSGASILLVRPRDGAGRRRHRREAPARARRRHRRRAVPARAPSPSRGTTRRGRDRHDQLHVGHDGAAEGRADDAPHPVAQRRDLRLAHGRRATATCTCTRCRCSTATGGACRTR